MARARRRSAPQHSRALAAQGAYYLATGVAPFLSRRWFERVTGPKTEWWLVQTTGLLVTVSGAGLISAVARDRVTPEVVGMAAGWAASLAAIDVIYVARRRIAPTYLADAGIELGLLAALAAGAGGGRRRRGPRLRRPA
jgi:hypothetical protein